MKPRRRFLKSLAAAPLLPVALARHASATAPPVPNLLTGEEPASGAEVADALAEVVRRRYGSQLGVGDLDAIRKELGKGLESAERLQSKLRLTNADGPVLLFEAEPPETRAERAARRGRR